MEPWGGRNVAWRWGRVLFPRAARTRLFGAEKIPTSRANSRPPNAHAPSFLVFSLRFWMYTVWEGGTSPMSARGADHLIGRRRARPGAPQRSEDQRAAPTQFPLRRLPECISGGGMARSALNYYCPVPPIGSAHTFLNGLIANHFLSARRDACAGLPLRLRCSSLLRCLEPLRRRLPAP